MPRRPIEQPNRGTILALIGAACLFAHAAMADTARAPEIRTLDSGWQVSLAPGDTSAADHAAALAWHPAGVPGAVQTDLMADGLLADPWTGENERAAQWVGLSDWRYRRDLVLDATTLGRPRVDLVFEGLDTFATVKINGVVALEADNMFRSWRVDARSLLHTGHNTIEIDFQSPIERLAPMVRAMAHPLPGSYDSAFGDEPKGRQTANYVRKANYQYGWDWAPRIVTIGVWRPVRLEAYDGVRLDDLHVAQTHLDADIAVLDAGIETWTDQQRTVSLRLVITDPTGHARRITQAVTLYPGSNTSRISIPIDHPRRWWPVGYGRPDLYDVDLTVEQGAGVLGHAHHAIGLRTVELRRTHDTWGRSFAFVVNGVPIFAKGANLEPTDSFPSRVDPGREAALFEAAVAANMNMLRVWGGGYYLDDAAYETADRLGLMLWQEFMFGGALPPDDPAFRENVRLEATEQVRRLRDHPSIVLWCGNNEVQTSWEHWPDRQAFKATLSPDERDRIDRGMVRLFDGVLRQVVAVNDPGVPYTAGSPSTDYDGASDQMTDGDTHFWTVWVSAPIQDYATTTPRFMSEFGIQSMPSMTTIGSFLAPRRARDIPVRITDSGYDSGRGNARVLGYIRAEYGEPRSFADYVYLSQLVQAEGIDLAVSHLRASRPRTMGALYWTLNDSWPGQINSVWAGPAWGSIDFYGHWKALQYHARRFNAPVALVALHVKDETDLSLVSDRQTPVDATWSLKVFGRDGTLVTERHGARTLPPLSATSVLALKDDDIGHPDPSHTVAIAEMTVGGKLVGRRFVYFGPARTIAFADPKLRMVINRAPGGGYTVAITSHALARGVWIDAGDANGALSDNAFDMAPGETVTLALSSGETLETLRRSLTVRSLFGAASP